MPLDFVAESRRQAEATQLGAARAHGDEDTLINHVALPNGYRLAEYSIEALLGCGGFGLTYRARDNHLECDVAIKEYLPQDMALRVEGQTVCARAASRQEDYQAGLKRFLAEARTLASFRHPNIVRITRFFEANGTAYMVMDYERGEPLREWKRTRRVVTEDEILRMFLPLLEGLEVVHQGGVTHRDIKPANIYVRETDGSLVLLDFGSARQTVGASEGLTTIVTPGYAPFEQYHSRGAQGPWSDIYAMGGVLYWLISGEKPLEAPARLKDDIMTPVAEIGRGRFSAAFLAAIDWALRSDEKTRPRSVADFKAALTGQIAVPPPTADAAAAAPAPTSSTPARATPRKSGIGLWLGAGAVALSSLGFAAWHFMHKPGAEAAQSAQPKPVATTPPVVQAPPTPPVPLAAAEPVTEPQPAPPIQKPVPAVEPTRASAKPNHKATESKASATKPVPTAGAQAMEEPRRQPGESAAQSARLSIKVEPYGEVFLDGRRIGKAPPLADLPVSAGKHRLEVRGDAMPYIAIYNLELKAGETRQIWAKFGNGL